MKTYVNPQTMCLNVNAQTVLCASGGAPQRRGQLETMSVSTGSWDAPLV